jgi:serine/threonine protein phosphatase PrpC
VDALIPIGEFSQRSGLSPRRLRSYAAEGLLVPAAIDPSSGYRFYSPTQLSSALVIDALRQASVPLADIRAFLDHPSRRTIDTWANELRTDADRRREALLLARRLVAVSDDPDSPISINDTEETLMTILRTSGRADIGLVRENNEDAIVNSDRLVLVADGMGGHPGGEIAANAVAGLIQAAFTGQSGDELESAVRAANWAIRDRAQTEPGLEGMGTTICAAGLLEHGEIAVVNVGDSRAYLWRKGSLIQLTRDHSVTADLVQRGELQDEDVAQHPYYGVLTRALGVGPDVEIDRTMLTLEEADRILICSDGLFNEVPSVEIAGIMAMGGDVATVVDSLVDKAIGVGGRDNVSVVIAEMAA